MKRTCTLADTVTVTAMAMVIRTHTCTYACACQLAPLWPQGWPQQTGLDWDWAGLG